MYCSNNPAEFECTLFKQCKDADGEESDAKKKCVEEVCEEHQDKFECQAIKCKKSFPKPLQIGARINCIKTHCQNNTEHKICKVLNECFAKDGFEKLRCLKKLKSV